jgi:hypothetical protein
MMNSSMTMRVIRGEGRTESLASPHDSIQEIARMEQAPNSIPLTNHGGTCQITPAETFQPPLSY